MLRTDPGGRWPVLKRVACLAVIAVLAVAVGGLTSCTGSSDGQRDRRTTTPDRVSWTRERAIPDIRPGGISTDPTTGTTYVGGSVPATTTSAYSGPLIRGGTRKPVLWVRDPNGSWREPRLTVTSFYGAQATLASLSAYQRVVGLGAVAGGAHANPRPSFFVGGPTAIAEREQNFYLYGGENAVGIVSVAAGPRTLLMVGQWAPDGHRASGALWMSTDGARYVRHDEIPGLGDSAGGQRTTSPQAAAAVGDRFVVVGSVTDLTKPTLSITPAVWLSDGTSVRQGSLPAAAGVLGGPGAIACTATEQLAGAAAPPGTCLTAGLVTVAGASRLAAWRVAVSGSATGSATGHALDLAGCPAPPPAADPGESTPRPPRVRVSIGSDGSGWIVASTSRAGIACRVGRSSGGDSVRPVTVPPGCLPVAVQAPAGPATGEATGPAELICADADGVTAYRQG